MSLYVAVDPKQPSIKDAMKPKKKIALAKKANLFAWSDESDKEEGTSQDNSVGETLDGSNGVELVSDISSGPTLKKGKGDTQKTLNA